MNFEGSGFTEVSNDNTNNQGQKSYGQNQGSGSGGYQGNNGGGYKGGGDNYRQGNNGGGQGPNGGYRPNGGGGSGWGGNSGGGNRGGYQGGGGNRGGFQGRGGGGFNRNQEPEGPVELYLPYVATGPRDTPQPIAEKIVALVKELETRGYTLRNAGREPAEDLFEKAVTRKEVHLPWRGFLEKDSKFTFTPEAAKVLAAKFHPGYEGLKPAIQVFLAADVRMVMGKELKSPALFLITWSEDGAETLQERTAKTGTAAQAIAVANALKIPVFNFGKPSAEERFRQYLGKANEQQQPQSQPQQSAQQPIQQSNQAGYNPGSNYAAH